MKYQRRKLSKMIEIKDGKVYVAPGMYLQNADGTPMSEEDYMKMRKKK